MSMRFKSEAVGLVLKVLISVDGAPPPMGGTTTTLEVPGNGIESFVMTPGSQDGEATYVVQASDFDPGSYSARVRWQSGSVLLISDRFLVQVT